jgi:putative hydrolase of the HAD superfamily
VGEGAIEWYDIQYWFRFFHLEKNWKDLMGQYVDKIKIYPDVHDILDGLKGRFPILLTSNAGREFIDMEMEATGLKNYFDQIFSATSDFGEVKKTTGFYQKICQLLKANPNEIIHIGDHYEFDYRVPLSLGIRAFYLDRTGKQSGTFVISDLWNFEKKLSSIAEDR